MTGPTDQAAAGDPPPGDLPLRPYDLDDDLQAAALAEGRPQLRVIPWTGVAVVIGRGGKQSLELNTERIAADRVALYRRPGGGCAVVLDPGNLIVSLAVPMPGIGGIKSAFAAISEWLIAALSECGVPGVRQQGVSDLAISAAESGAPERKIGGSCIYRTRGLLYYSTTLLIDPDLDLVDRYLPHPPREPDYRAGRSHRRFMGSLVAREPACGTSEWSSLLRSRLADSLSPLGELLCE